jgi:Tol biopolymer transport system component
MHKSVSTGLLVVVVALVAGQGNAGGGGQSGASEAILFERKGDLYAVAVNGSRTVQLTKTGTLELEPAVSPDGRSIAYTAAGRGNRHRGRLGRGYELWTMSVDGKRRTRLTRGLDSYPAWSPDGETIFFSRAFENRYGDACRSILRVRKNGRGLGRVTRPDGRHSHWDAAVSPDGRRVAFTDEAGCESGASSFALRVVDASGRRTSDLSRLPGNAYSYSDADHEDPTWSPDGSRVAFYRSNQRNPGVHVANRDGSGMRRVTPKTLGGHSPAWSPDGAWIAFVGRRGIYVIHPDGTGLRSLTRTKRYESSPAWLPQLPTG